MTLLAARPRTDAPGARPHPPAALASAVAGRPRLVIGSLVVFLALAIAAWAGHGSLLLHVDRPVESWVIAHRTHALTAFFRHLTFLGSTDAVVIGAVVLTLVAAPRCRTAAAFVVVATLARPPLEWSLKRLVDRSRPQLSQLLDGHGPSFPCGHIMAASVLWTLVPLVVSLYVSDRRLRRVADVVSVAVIGLIGCSRVYLGVHWPTDVVGGAIAGTMLVAVLDRGFATAHRRHACRTRSVAARTEDVPRTPALPQPRWESP